MVFGLLGAVSSTTTTRLDGERNEGQGTESSINTAAGKKAGWRGRRSRCRCSSDRDGDEGVAGRDQRHRREKWPGCSRFLSAGMVGAPRAARICFSIAANLPFLVPPNSIVRAAARSRTVARDSVRGRKRPGHAVLANRSADRGPTYVRRSSRSCSIDARTLSECAYKWKYRSLGKNGDGSGGDDEGGWIRVAERKGPGGGRGGGSVGTISADACSYAVRILLSRTEIPAGFLRSLSSRAARGQGETKQGRDVGGRNAMGNGRS